MQIVRYEANAIYSKAVEANGFVFTAGIVPANLNADAKGQAAEVLAEIDRLLALAGTSKEKVLFANLWLSDVRHREAVNEAWSAWMGGQNAPARAAVEAKLVDPRMLVEIGVIAVK
jgi:enamine deaminase RidA (YjgF/YER057c/UK114 family)